MWRRRELHPRLRFRKSSRRMILASNRGASGCNHVCTEEALQELVANPHRLTPLVRTAILDLAPWLLILGTMASARSWHGRVASFASGRRTRYPSPKRSSDWCNIHEALDKRHEGAKSRKELEGTEKPRDGFQEVNLRNVKLLGDCSSIWRRRQ